MLHTRSCNFVKFQALVVTIECFKCDELSRPLCQMQLNFDVFDHFLTVKVAEILGGFAPQIPQHQGSRSKKPCASVNNVGPGRKVGRIWAERAGKADCVFTRRLVKSQQLWRRPSM